MATFSETFLCTALPAGITGTKVRLAVLVSPRLSSDSSAKAALDNWPDARDWPDIRPTWEVTIAQGGRTVTVPGIERVVGSYDAATWKALFPRDMPITPYRPDDRSQAPIASYPVAKVMDAVKEVHIKVLATSRTEFPAVRALEQIAAFGAMKAAVHQSRSITGAHVPGPDPLPDSKMSMADALSMVELFHGVRPGSQEAPPIGIAVSPSTGPAWGGTLVTVTGANLLGATEVRFGGNAATEVVVASRTSLTCRSPQGSEGATVDVTVNAPSGRSTPSPAARFTYKSPKPKIASLQPSFTEGGTATVTITGMNLGHVTAGSFGPQIIESLRIVSDTEISCEAPPVAGPKTTIVEVNLANAAGSSEMNPLFTYWKPHLA